MAALADAEWLELLDRCDRYLASEGHLNVPARYLDVDGYPLGSRLHQQRRRHRQGALRPDLVAALTARGMVWEPGAVDGQPSAESIWRYHLNQLGAFRRRHGTANVPQRYVDPIDGFTLGRWLNHQRTAHRQGTLSTSRLQALLDTGVDFDSASLQPAGRTTAGVRDAHRSRKADTWDRALDAARCAVLGGQDLNQVLVRTGTPDDPRLGRWLSIARRANREGALPAEVAADLSALGFEFATPLRLRSQPRHRSGASKAARP